MSSYENLTQDNIIFKEAKEYKVKIKYSNGKKGALVIESPVLFSFGVSEKKNQETKKLIGYSIPVCLWAKDSVPNNKGKAFLDVINNVTTLSQQHLEILIKKERRKQESIPHLHQFFTQNLFTRKNQRKFYLCLRERVVRI